MRFYFPVCETHLRLSEQGHPEKINIGINPNVVRFRFSPAGLCTADSTQCQQLLCYFLYFGIVLGCSDLHEFLKSITNMTKQGPNICCLMKTCPFRKEVFPHLKQ